MNGRLPWMIFAIVGVMAGCASTRQPTADTAPDVAMVATPEARPWLERRVVSLLPGVAGDTYFLNGGRAAHISVGDRVVWQDFAPTGEVVEVFEFRCRVHLPRPDNTSPKVKEQVRVWLNGAEPEPWPAR